MSMWIIVCAYECVPHSCGCYDNMHTIVQLRFINVCTCYIRQNSCQTECVSVCNVKTFLSTCAYIVVIMVVYMCVLVGLKV